MNIERANPQKPAGVLRPDAAAPVPVPADPNLAETCRNLDARGVKYTVVNGVAVVQRGFPPGVKGTNLFEQCLEMNRQAVVKHPAG